MSRIFWDTNLFIYLFEGHGPLSHRVAELRESMLRRGDQLLTSTLTIGEILVKPMERGDAQLSRKYEDTLTATSLLIPFDLRAAKIYAALRVDRSLLRRYALAHEADRGDSIHRSAGARSSVSLPCLDKEGGTPQNTSRRNKGEYV